MGSRALLVIVFLCFFCCCEKWWVSTTIRDGMFSESNKLVINHGGKHGYLRKCLVGLECHQPKYMWFVRVREPSGRCSFSNMIFKFLQVLLMALFWDVRCSTVHVFSGFPFLDVCPTHGNSHGLMRIQQLPGRPPHQVVEILKRPGTSEKSRPVYKTCQKFVAVAPHQIHRCAHNIIKTSSSYINVTPKKKHDTKNAPKKHGIFPPPNLMANNQLTPLLMWKKNQETVMMPAIKASWSHN